MAKRPSGNCEKCGLWRQRLNRDHIIPKWKGGGEETTNFQHLCANCHEDKTIEDMKDYRHSEETRANISFGVSTSRTHNLHVAEANRKRAGRVMSSESRQRSSIAAYKRWAKTDVITEIPIAKTQDPS